jgi:hypothetical protein
MNYSKYDNTVDTVDILPLQMSCCHRHNPPIAGTFSQVCAKSNAPTWHMRGAKGSYMDNYIRRYSSSRQWVRNSTHCQSDSGIEDGMRNKYDIVGEIAIQLWSRSNCVVGAVEIIFWEIPKYPRQYPLYSFYIYSICIFSLQQFLRLPGRNVYILTERNISIHCPPYISIHMKCHTHRHLY